MELKIPQRTAEKLDGPLFEGGRHALIIQIAMPMVGDGIPESEIFSIIRQKMPPDKTDKEIHDVIRWCQYKNPTPTQYNMPATTYQPKPVDHLTPDQARHNVTKFLNGYSAEESAIIRRSPVPIPEWEDGARVLFEHLYTATDHLNLVCQFTQPDGKPDKASPKGGGKTQSRDEWIAFFKEKGTPASNAGCWVRPNPVKAAGGTGASGSIQDCDVASCRFLLVESDCIPLADQLAMLSKLRLPIAAIISSGGASYHAWIDIKAEDHPAFSLAAERLFGILSKFGIDRANKNPSRLARLPGAARIIGGSSGGQQRLVYLNPNAESKAIL